jgi:glutaredoxin
MERTSVKPYPVFTVYGAKTCHYCALAQEILENYGHEYNYVDVTASKSIQQAFFEKTSHAKTVPQIFVDEPMRGYEVHVGGYDDLVAWLTGKYKSKGKHEPMSVGQLPILI